LAGIRIGHVVAVTGRSALIERAEALARVDHHLREAVAGQGSVLLLEGQAGIGKTSVVMEALSRGRHLGLTTLSARGSDLEREFAYGLVRQLFEAPLVAADPRERSELLAGAASHAAPLFNVTNATDDPADALLDPSFAILHGLYWLCANLCRRSPMLLSIDDIHWADQASLRFLHYLTRRIEELPVVVVAAARPGESADGSRLLAALAAEPPTETVGLRPLSEKAVAELMRTRLGADVETAFANACHDATGGVPFFVLGLVREVADQAIEPIATNTTRITVLSPRVVSDSVLLRLRGLSADARAMARATAVLGESDLRLAAGLAGVDMSASARAADELAAVAILDEGRPLRFVHPIVRAAVDADLSPGERGRMHADAARRLAADGASPQRIAIHLLKTDPAGDDRVVESLQAAARAATASGAPDSAAVYLRRALAEPPSPLLLPGVLLELGFAESYAGDPGAAAHLEAALDLATDIAAHMSATLALGRILQIDGRNREALDVYNRTISRLTNVDRRAALVLKGAALTAAQLLADTADEATTLIAELRHHAEKETDVPDSVFAPLAIAAETANEPAETAVRLAWRALKGAPKLLPEAVDRPAFFYHACIALTFGGHYQEALARFDEAIADARRLGSLSHVLGLSCYRAMLHLHIGNLAEAEADARVALETGPRPPGFHALAALAVLLETLAERGETSAAEAANERLHRVAEQFPTMLHCGWLLSSRGRLRLAELRPASALEDLSAAGDLFLRVNAHGAALAPWRSDAGLAKLALGEGAEARALVLEEVGLARLYQAPRPLGMALRAAGLVEGGSGGIELLRQAVGVLEPSGARLEYTRAMCDLGMALRHAGRRAESIEILRQALDVAHRCGALALTERTHSELIAAGGRPRRMVLSGAESLTPSERRIAQLAATGLSNRDIAQHLFITARTVEGHLTHAYQKLGISSREQLVGALG
jgi:DNA-binding CsgD family transcriptional regulator